MLILLGTVVALVPLPFGSTDPFIVAVWCGILGLGLCLSAMVRVGQGQGRALALIIAVAVCIVALAAFQLSGGLGLVSPDPIWAKAAAALGQPLDASISVVRWQPFYAAGPMMAFVATLILAVTVSGNRTSARQLMKVVAWSGLVYALYGIVAALATPDMVLWRQREGYDRNVLGTFMLRNTAATYFGTVTVVWLVFFCEALRKVLPSDQFTWKRFNAKVLSRPPRSIAVPAIGTFVGFMALFMTGSRAGTILWLLGFAGVAVAMFWSDVPRVAGRTRVLVIGLLAMVLVLELFGGSVSTRFNLSGLDDEGRFAIQEAALKIVADHPWFGTGLGTFPLVFPSYRQIPPEMSAVVERAFSTPLELAVELGLPMLSLIAVAIAVVLVGMARRLRDAGGRRPFILAGLATGLVALTHSFIDYPLQITGMAVTAAAVVGVGVGQAYGPRRRRVAGGGRRAHTDEPDVAEEPAPAAAQSR